MQFLIVNNNQVFNKKMPRKQCTYYTLSIELLTLGLKYILTHDSLTVNLKYHLKI